MNIFVYVALCNSHLRIHQNGKSTTMHAVARLLIMRSSLCRKKKRERLAVASLIGFCVIHRCDFVLPTDDALPNIVQDLQRFDDLEQSPVGYQR